MSESDYRPTYSNATVSDSDARSRQTTQNEQDGQESRADEYDDGDWRNNEQRAQDDDDAAFAASYADSHPSPSELDTSAIAEHELSLAELPESDDEQDDHATANGGITNGDFLLEHAKSHAATIASMHLETHMTSALLSRLTRLPPNRLGFARDLDASHIGRTDGRRIRVIASMEDVPNIHRLNLSSQAIKAIGAGLAPLRALRVLNLENNGLERIDGIWHLADCLEELVLAHNALTKIPTKMGTMHALRSLRVERNRIVALSDLEQLHACHNLVSLCAFANPCADSSPLYRIRIVHALRGLEVMDSTAVTIEEREAAIKRFGGEDDYGEHSLQSRSRLRASEERCRQLEDDLTDTRQAQHEAEQRASKLSKRVAELEKVNKKQLETITRQDEELKLKIEELQAAYTKMKRLQTEFEFYKIDHPTPIPTTSTTHDHDHASHPTSHAGGWSQVKRARRVNGMPHEAEEQEEEETKQGSPAGAPTDRRNTAEWSHSVSDNSTRPAQLLLVSASSDSRSDEYSNANSLRHRPLSRSSLPSSTQYLIASFLTIDFQLDHLNLESSTVQRRIAQLRQDLKKVQTQINKIEQQLDPDTTSPAAPSSSPSPSSAASSSTTAAHSFLAERSKLVSRTESLAESLPKLHQQLHALEARIEEAEQQQQQHHSSEKQEADETDVSVGGALAATAAPGSVAAALADMDRTHEINLTAPPTSAATSHDSAHHPHSSAAALDPLREQHAALLQRIEADERALDLAQHELTSGDQQWLDIIRQRNGTSADSTLSPDEVTTQLTRLTAQLSSLHASESELHNAISIESQTLLLLNAQSLDLRSMRDEMERNIESAKNEWMKLKQEEFLRENGEQPTDEAEQWQQQWERMLTQTRQDKSTLIKLVFVPKLIELEAQIRRNKEEMRKLKEQLTDVSTSQHHTPGLTSSTTAALPSQPESDPHLQIDHSRLLELHDVHLSLSNLQLEHAELKTELDGAMSINEELQREKAELKKLLKTTQTNMDFIKEQKRKLEENLTALKAENESLQHRLTESLTNVDQSTSSFVSPVAPITDSTYLATLESKVRDYEADILILTQSQHDLQGKLHQSNTDHTKLRESYEEVQKTLEATQALLDDAETAARKYQDESNNFQSQLTALEAEKRSLNESIDALTWRLESKNAEVSRIQSELEHKQEAWETERKKMNEQRQQLHTAHSPTQASLNQQSIASLAERCRHLEQELGVAHAAVASKAEALTFLQQEHETTCAKLRRECEARVAEVERLQHQFDQQRTKHMEELSQAKQQHAPALADLQLASLHESLAASREQKASMERVHEAELDRLRADSQQQQQRLQKELLASDDARVQVVTARLDSITQERDEIEHQLCREQGSHQSLQRRFEELQRELQTKHDELASAARDRQTNETRLKDVHMKEVTSLQSQLSAMRTALEQSRSQVMELQRQLDAQEQVQQSSDDMLRQAQARIEELQSELEAQKSVQPPPSSSISSQKHPPSASMDELTSALRSRIDELETMHAAERATHEKESASASLHTRAKQESQPEVHASLGRSNDIDLDSLAAAERKLASLRSEIDDAMNVLLHLHNEVTNQRMEQERRQKLSDEIAEMQRTLAWQIEEERRKTKQQLDAETNQLVEMKQQVERMRVEFNEAIEALESESAKVSRSRAEYSALREKLETAFFQYKQLEQRLAAIRAEAETSESTLTDTQAEVTNQSRKLRQVNESIEAVKVQQSMQEKRLKELLKDVEAIQVKRAQQEKELNKVTNQVDSMERKHQQQSKQELKQRQQLDELEKQVASRQAKVNELERRLREGSDLESQIAAQRTHAQHLHSRMQEAEKEYTSLQLQVNDARTTLQELQNQDAAARTQKHALLKEVEMLQREAITLRSHRTNAAQHDNGRPAMHQQPATDTNNVDQNEADLRSERELLQRAVDDLHEELAHAMQSSQMELAELQTRRNALTEEVQDAQKQLASLRSRIVDAEQEWRQLQERVAAGDAATLSVASPPAAPSSHRTDSSTNAAASPTISASATASIPSVKETASDNEVDSEADEKATTTITCEANNPDATTGNGPAITATTSGDMPPHHENIPRCDATAVESSSVTVRSTLQASLRRSTAPLPPRSPAGSVRFAFHHPASFTPSSSRQHHERVDSAPVTKMVMVDASVSTSDAADIEELSSKVSQPVHVHPPSATPTGPSSARSFSFSSVRTPSQDMALFPAFLASRPIISPSQRSNASRSPTSSSMQPFSSPKWNLPGSSSPSPSSSSRHPFDQQQRQLAVQRVAAVMASATQPANASASSTAPTSRPSHSSASPAMSPPHSSPTATPSSSSTSLSQSSDSLSFRRNQLAARIASLTSTPNTDSIQTNVNYR